MNEEGKDKIKDATKFLLKEESSSPNLALKVF